MDAELKKNSLTLLYLGLGLQVAGWAWSAFFPIEAIRRSGPLMISAGGVAILFAAIRLAKAKGYAWFYGLVGLCGVLGYGVVLYLLADKSERPGGT